MKTIIYQGQSIDVEPVAYTGGEITGWSRGEYECIHIGEESLYRDAQGTYYLHRALRWIDYESDLQRRASGREHVHRVSLKAAALWTAVRLNSQNDLFKRDLAAALSAPASTSGTRHFADGSMAVTLHLKPGPAELVRDAAQTCGVTPVRYTYESLAQHAVADLADNNEQETAMEATFADNASEDEDERTVVNLRHADGRLYARVPLEPDLEAMLEEKARREGTDIGTALLNCLREFFQQPETPPDETTEPTRYGVSQSTLEAAARYAATAGRTVDEMIVDWLEEAATLNPGEQAGARPTSASQPAPGFADLDDTARELLANYLAENPDDDPRDVLNAAVEFLLTDDGQLDTDTQAIMWANDRRLAQEATGKHHVAFSVWLTEEQMREGLQANFPVSAVRPLSAYFSALIPMEGAPSLTVDGKSQEGFEQAVQRQRESTLVSLDAEADRLVRRYLKVTPWEFTAADIINACVVYAMNQVFGDVAPVALNGELDAEEYDDSSWGYVEQNIVAATRRRTGKEAVVSRSDWSKQDAETELEPEMTEYSTSVNKNRSKLNLPPRWSRGAKPNPADVALLAASAPEEEEPTPPATEDDEHLPVEEHVDDPEEGTATPDGEEGK